MIISIAVLVFFLLVAALALGVFIVQSRTEHVGDTFKVAIGSLASTFAVLVGGLGVPGIEAKLSAQGAGAIGSWTIDSVKITSGAPIEAWYVALFTVAALFALFGWYRLKAG